MIKIYRDNKDYLAFGVDKKKISVFKKRYNIGDKIRGKVIRVLDKKRAIIDVEGLRLVAYLTVDIRDELEGRYIDLEVLRLTPYIQLKFVPSKKDGLNLYI